MVWIIDPVDGTTNLVHGLPHVAISVGLYDSGSAVLGVVHNPVTDTSYLGAAGEGSYERIGSDPSGDRQLRVSDVATLDAALASFGLPYDRSLTEPLFRTLEAVFSRTQDLRRSGSAALDLAVLARGNLDIHVEATVRPWDCAAGGLILEEAGGVVTDWNGDGIRWLDHIPGSSLLASNGHLHEETPRRGAGVGVALPSTTRDGTRRDPDLKGWRLARSDDAYPGGIGGGTKLVVVDDHRVSIDPERRRQVKRVGRPQSPG